MSIFDEPPVIPDRADRVDWLDGLADAAVAAVAADLAQLGEATARAWFASLTAAGDPGVFDGVRSRLWRLVNRLAGDSADTFLTGAMASWGDSGGKLSTTAQGVWASVLNQRAVEWETAATQRIQQQTWAAWDEMAERIRSELTAENRALLRTIADVTGVAQSRTDMIGRTEIHAAYNAGLYDGAFELPDELRPVEKEWLSSEDARVRPSHTVAHGQRRPLRELFDVAGTAMARPHDPHAPAAEVVGCRCVLVLYWPGDTRLDGTVVEAGQPTPLSTEAQFSRVGPDGRAVWDSDRVESVHDPVVESTLAEGVTRDDPWVTFLGGGPASGKSHIGELLRLRDGAVVIDPDKFKLAIPEYEAMLAAADKRAAAFVHEESSFLSKRVMREAIERDYDTVLDGTGDGTYEKLSRKVATARQQGAHRIVGEYVTVDTDEAVRRAMKRAERTGRLVPETVIRRTHESVSDVFEQSARDRIFDELRLYDNNGVEPLLIFEQIDGHVMHLDEQLYERFLRKNPDFHLR